MQKTLLTFGDSNTFGTKPMVNVGKSDRFEKGIRWPTVTQAKLGPEWELIACGLPGRTATDQLDPVMGPHMNGQIGLKIALASNAPIDVLTIMLGTNDCRASFGLTAQGIAGAIAALIAIAKAPDIQEKHGGFEIFLIAPPLVQECGIFVEGLWQAAEKSAALPALYQGLAAHTNISFLDASKHIETCSEDGLHFDANAHQTLGQAVAKHIASLHLL